MGRVSYTLDIKKMEDAIKKLKKNKKKPDVSFKAPSREHLNSLDAKTLSIAPPSTKYEPKDPKMTMKVRATIDNAELNRDHIFIKKSPCVSDLKPTHIEKKRVKPEFFAIMRDVEDQERYIIETLEDERQIKREKYDNWRQKDIKLQKQRRELQKLGITVEPPGRVKKSSSLSNYNEKSI